MGTDAETDAAARADFLNKIEAARKENRWVTIVTRSGREYGGRIMNFGRGAVEIASHGRHSISVSLLVIESVEVHYQ